MTLRNHPPYPIALDETRSLGQCVLTFHRIVAGRERDHDVIWNSFSSLLDVINESRAVVTSSFDPSRGGLALTLDDGTVDHAAVGEELARRKLRGIFFIAPTKLGTPGYLSEVDVRRLSELGHIVGAHGLRHVRLGGLSQEEIRQEVAGSKQCLEEILGIPVQYFAPPGGEGSPYLRAELERAGFVASRTMRWGISRPGGDQLGIPCVPVTELTIGRGWVATALARGRLPILMRGAWVAKSLTPRRSYPAIRRFAHAWSSP